MEKLVGETFNMALLDSGCTKTVCGESWLKFYIETLSEEEVACIKFEESDSTFKFGDSKLIKANRRVTIPTVIAGTSVDLTTDVIDYDIPLLLSKEAMKNANTQIDFKDDKVSLFGRKVDIKFSSSGHYCIPINSDIHKDKVMENIILLCNNSTSKESKVAIAKKKSTVNLHTLTVRR